MNGETIVSGQRTNQSLPVLWRRIAVLALLVLGTGLFISQPAHGLGGTNTAACATCHVDKPFRRLGVVGGHSEQLQWLGARLPAEAALVYWTGSSGCGTGRTRGVWLVVRRCASARPRWEGSGRSLPRRQNDTESDAAEGAVGVKAQTESRLFSVFAPHRHAGSGGPWRGPVHGPASTSRGRHELGGICSDRATLKATGSLGGRRRHTARLHRLGERLPVTAVLVY